MEEHPLFTLRPNITVAIVPIIFSSLLAAFFGGIIAGFGAKSSFLGFVVGVVLGAVAFFFSLMNLRARRYIFYKNKAEFYEGFLTIVQRTVNYNKVTDCILKKTVWDRMFGTGTIRLLTAGHEGGQTAATAALGGGLVIQFIDNPDDVFKRVQKLLAGK